jgi:hypothetical protein
MDQDILSCRDHRSRGPMSGASNSSQFQFGGPGASRPPRSNPCAPADALESCGYVALSHPIGLAHERLLTCMVRHLFCYVGCLDQGCADGANSTSLEWESIAKKARSYKTRPGPPAICSDVEADRIL